MIFFKGSLVLLMLSARATMCGGECVSPSTLSCNKTMAPPTLDGDLSDWSAIEGTELPITGALGAVAYEPGNLGIKCLYDDNQIYFAIEVPGAYRFDTEDNHLCAAISTMMKIGQNATYVNMGGCPNAMEEKCDAVPSSCNDYKVDIGGHWELKTTEMGKEYPINIADGTGDDAVANKDDEYGVSPLCRFDDDGEKAGNEWAGAWSHTSQEVNKPVSRSADGLESSVGSYIFELSRLLKTESPDTDTQLEAGMTYSFGVAYWDPYENEETGWTDAGHFVTGCSQDWIDLVLIDASTDMANASTVKGDESSIKDASPKSGSILATTAALVSGALSVVVYNLI